MYHTSAVLAAHVETSTLPLRCGSLSLLSSEAYAEKHRMKNTHDDLSSFIGRLNWQGFTSFGQLSGTFPVIGAVKYEDDVYNFSSGRLNNVRGTISAVEVLLKQVLSRFPHHSLAEM